MIVNFMQPTLLIRLVTIFFVGVTCVISVDAAPASGPDAEVGIAAVDIEPAVGILLAGYGAKIRRVPVMIEWTNKYPGAFYFKLSTGRHSVIRGKATAARGRGWTKYNALRQPDHHFETSDQSSLSDEEIRGFRCSVRYTDS
jgi:hypothetical protein